MNVVVSEEGTRFKVAELQIDENVFTSPVKVLYKSVNQNGEFGDTWEWNYRPGIDKFGLWQYVGGSSDPQESWMWRKPAIHNPSI